MKMMRSGMIVSVNAMRDRGMTTGKLILQLRIIDEDDRLLPVRFIYVSSKTVRTYVPIRVVVNEVLGVVEIQGESLRQSMKRKRDD